MQLNSSDKLLPIISEGRSTIILRYGLALLFCGATILIASILSSYSVKLNLTILVVLSIIIPTWYGGKGPGLLVSFLFEAVTIISNPIPPPNTSLGNFIFGHVSVLLFYIFLVFLVSSRRNAETLLREQREWLRVTLSSIGDAVIATDVKGSINFINTTAEDLTGWTLEEAAGKPLAEVFNIISETTRHRCENPVTKVLQEKNVVNLDSDTVLITRNGKEILIESSSAPIRAEEEQVIGVILVFHDITERKKYENALRQYSLLIEQSYEPIFVWDLEHGIVEWNTGCELLYGYTKKEALGQISYKLLRTSFPIPLEKFFSELERHSWWTGEVRHQTKNGTEVLAESRYQLIELGGRRIVLQTNRDITERRKAEEELRQSEQRYRRLFESIPQPMWVYDKKSLAFLEVNKAAIHHYGYSRKEFLSMTIKDIRPDEDFLPLLDSISKETEPYEPIVWQHKKKDGTIIDVEITMHDFAFNKRPARLVLVNDITERRALEEQLRQAQKLESIGQLAGGVAHDFNNLLTAITGYSDLALRRLHPEDSLHNNFVEIKRAADRATSLTRQLLAFSRKQVLQPKILDLNAVISEIEKLLRRLIGEDIELRAVLDTKLGSVKADPGQIEQVIMNLVINARDAMPAGGKLIIETKNIFLDEEYAHHHISVTPGHYIMLAVSDTGIGMDVETQKRIFEPFFTTKDQGKGTGLGLSTVYGIVKQSGGNIWVYSEVGRGSTFKVYLPRVDEEAQEYKQINEIERNVKGTETILLTEDEEIVRKLAREVLESYGYQILEAENGKKALTICENYPDLIQLLITDVVMPEMGGRELADSLIKLRPKMKILFMSGYTDDAIIHHGILNSDTSFIQKPFTMDDLTNKVREMLDSSSGS